MTFAKEWCEATKKWNVVDIDSPTIGDRQFASFYGEDVAQELVDWLNAREQATVNAEKVLAAQNA